MTSGRLAIIVPGILGSTLSYPRRPENIELWGENLIENYRRLCDQPTILDWSHGAAPANSALLKSIRTSRFVPYLKATLYQKLSIEAAQLDGVSEVVECSYDWRDSVLNSCLTVANRIQRSYPADLSAQPRSANPKLIFLAHSLGGLVLKSAVGQGFIQPGHIDRIIYIGSPLLGSPVAFRSQYSNVDLPFFSEFASLFIALEKERFKANLLSSFRTFRSLGELLPHEPIDFICYSPLLRSNPLREPYMDTTTRNDAFESAQHIPHSRYDS